MPEAPRKSGDKRGAAFPGALARMRVPLIAALLFCGTLIVFNRSIGYDFTNYDDPGYVTRNPHVTSGLTWSSVDWAFTGHADYWHPLSWISHMVDWDIHGANAAGHRLTSVLFHAVNAVLVLLVLRRLTGSFWTSALCAALFAWHPLRVESVVWITERKDVMSGFFFLLTLWSYAAYVDRRRESGRAVGRYMLTLACFACGLMSKPMLVSVPLVLLVLDFWPTGRAALPGTWHVWRGLLLEKVPFFVLSAGVSIVTVMMQTRIGGFVLELPLEARLGNAVVSVARYLGKFFWPVDLVVCYAHPGFWPAAVVVGASLLLVALCALAWWQRERRAWLLAGLAWFLAMLAPVIGIVQAGFQGMADRYTYLPILGVQIALLWTLRGLASRGAVRAGLGVAAAVVLALLVRGTWRQQAVWQDSLSLFSHAVAADSANHHAHAFLAYTLAYLGRLDEAEAHAGRSIALEERNAAAHYALALVRERRGDLTAAIAGYRTVLQISPDNGASEIALGELLLRTGRRDEAAQHLQRATRLMPESASRNLSRGDEMLQLGRMPEAVFHYDAASLASPDDPAAHFWMGFALARMGRTDEALGRFRTALELKPGHSGANVELGLIYLARGDASEAGKHFRSAIDSEPGLGLAHLGLARSLDQLGSASEAEESFKSALKLAPEDPTVQRAWAEALARRRRFAEAAQHYEKLVELQPRDWEARTGYGYMLVLTNRRAEAMREWEESLRLNPNQPSVRAQLEKLRGSR